MTAPQTTSGWAVPTPAGIPTVAVGNQKGGTGKTTTAINLSAALAQRGLRVLAIDLDTQGDLTEGVGLGGNSTNDPDNPKAELPNYMEQDDGPNLFDVIVNGQRTADATLDDVIVQQEEYEHLSFDVAPAHADMGLVRDYITISNENSRDNLRQTLADFGQQTDQYDVIIIDCPADLSVLTDMAFIAAQNILIAAKARPTSHSAVDALIKQLEELEEGYDITTALVGMVINEHRSDGQSQKFREQFESQWEQRIPIETLPQRVAIQRSWDHGRDIYTWDDANDQSTERDAYLRLADAVIDAFDISIDPSLAQEVVNNA